MNKLLLFTSMVFATIACLSLTHKPLTLHMVGDSTMAEKEDMDISPERGWGQFFDTYLDTHAIVRNYAKNGRSTKSFRTEGRWQKVLDNIHKGDVVLIQFGHNDAKSQDSTRYSSIPEYEQNLERMIDEAQAKKASVILCTSINRRTFKDGVFYSSLGEYPEAARRVAARKNVPLIDLEQRTASWLTELGDEASKAYFMNVPAGECIKYPDGKTDNTHLRENGARLIGQMAAEEIQRQQIKPLCRYIKTFAADYAK